MGKFKITRKERKQIVMYLGIVVFGSLLSKSIYDSFIGDLINAYGTTTIMLIGIGGIIALYYIMD